ncbi:hypothetical protein [[Clostridium] scindens]|uniref:hypothetical protein n=1 Tax=Clostridium scindens (strain JCM 10418 / VPI 12708) TaxID=29347 RepID=UPI002166EE82|nr:hypothetical protein [[Clostridium] scindens]
MTPKRKNLESIELLAEQAGCTYLSDLQLEEYRCRLEGCLQKMDIERYGEEEWADAANYLTGIPKEEIATKAQARRLILEKCRKE